MSNPSILIIDCEIVNMIPHKTEPKIEGLTYCSGWGDFTGMGISVIGAYSYLFDKYVPYIQNPTGETVCERNFYDFAEMLKSHNIIAGFNCKYFDFRIMAAHGIYIPDMSAYDIYLEVKTSAKANKYAPGYSLDSIAKANGLSGKTGRGEFAPKLWQEGKHQEVIDYCLQDVKITKEILDLIMEGKLRNPVNPDVILNVRKPGKES